MAGLRAWARAQKVRLQHIRYRLKSCPPSAYIAFGSRIATDFVVGEHSYIGPGAMICPGVRVGRYVMFGPEVMIQGRDHRFDQAGVPMIFSGRPEAEATTIEDDVWIGARSFLRAGVHIGRGAIVAAGSTVVDDVRPYEIVGGVPARLIRKRFEEEEVSIHERMLNGRTRSGALPDRRS